jgi:hypothetical protein
MPNPWVALRRDQLIPVNKAMNEKERLEKGRGPFLSSPLGGNFDPRGKVVPRGEFRSLDGCEVIPWGVKLFPGGEVIPWG